MKNILLVLICFYSVPFLVSAQGINWTSQGDAYYRLEKNDIVQYTLPANSRAVILEYTKLQTAPINRVKDFYLSSDHNKILIFTNTQRVWRLETQGDYWVFDRVANTFYKLGKGLSPSSLRFAKFSPDGKYVAYVSESNIYVEDLNQKTIAQLTTDGTKEVINGTFDWAYEEEFSCRDGFQWSPDGKRIAFWQIDASSIRDFYMINNTDSIYPRIIPIEYPKAGESPSAARIGVIDLSLKKTVWLTIPGDPQQHYLPRMEWNSPLELFVQQLNRKQNESKIFSCIVDSNQVRLVWSEKDAAWIDVQSVWEDSYGLTFRHEFKWINNKKEFIWISEKDGWRHLYRIDKNGKEVLITPGNFDVMELLVIDEKNGIVYYHASPDNATQKYLYKSKLSGTGKPELVSPSNLKGTHSYSISPGGKFASHVFHNTFTKPVREFVALPSHAPINLKESVNAKLEKAQGTNKVEFFKVKVDGVEMDGLMVKPTGFDPAKKYPVVFMVYSEPWGANVKDEYGAGENYLYNGSMADDGYIYITIDNRGTPAPKGREWRKCIYRKIGRVNIADQANAAKEILKWNFVDAERVAVWGWSGGGSATLNLLFQYPEIYKTGIAIAAVANQLTYDNIYQERYMGLPNENPEDFMAGSPITYAKNLKGNLLYIHGTGDDNVHYANAEMLINELIKHNKQFQLMIYPNRTHSISEGEGTNDHLSTMFTNYLKQYCPPGGR